MVQGTPGQTRPQKPWLLRKSLHRVRKPRAFKRGLFRNDTDPVPYFNRYRNSAYWTDGELARVTGYLKEKGLLENTIVVVSSDHGEEFNDNKLNYWGHNGNYTDAQIKVPLIVH